MKDRMEILCILEVKPGVSFPKFNTMIVVSLNIDQDYDLQISIGCSMNAKLDNQFPN